MICHHLAILTLRDLYIAISHTRPERREEQRRTHLHALLCSHGSKTGLQCGKIQLEHIGEPRAQPVRQCNVRIRARRNILERRLTYQEQHKSLESDFRLDNFEVPFEARCEDVIGTGTDTGVWMVHQSVRIFYEAQQYPTRA